MLGVVIGVGSVIAMIGIGEGTKQKSLEQIEIMGSNMLMVMPNWRRGGQAAGSDTPTLKPEDVEAIKREVPTIRYITGVAAGGVTAQFQGRSARTRVQGAEPQIAYIRNATRMHQGTWYTMEDEAMANRKAVLGYSVYEDLFGGDFAPGSFVRINGQNYEVVGVVGYKGGSGGGFNPDDTIYVPLKTAKERLLGRVDYSMIAMQASSTEFMPITQYQVEQVLRRTRTTAGGDELFRIMNQGEWIEQAQQQSQLLSFLLAGIASVSLLVGGIGIMNIMLVSVTERTREIGLRKAIGARKGSILSQFLLESVVMCLVGGLIGIGLGFLAVQYVSGALQVPPVVNVEAIMLAFGFSVFVGLFFGFYPAMRASSLQPIEALRHD